MNNIDHQTTLTFIRAGWCLVPQEQDGALQPPLVNLSLQQLSVCSPINHLPTVHLKMLVQIHCTTSKNKGKYLSQQEYSQNLQLVNSSDAP